MEEPEGLPVRRDEFRRDWTKGSIIGNTLLLSWPMIINQSLNMAGPTIDFIWVGKLGAAQIAGVGVGGMAVMIANATMMGLSVGVKAMIARFIGAGNYQGAAHVARQAFVVGATFSMVLALIGIFFAEPILVLFGLEPEVVAEGAAYMRVMFVGSISISFRIMSEGIMQSSGDALTPMKIAILLRLCHVILCPFLVLGWWIFPHLGVSGAALTNIISQSLGLALGLWALLGGHSRIRLTLRNFRLDLGIIWRIVRIGIPACVMSSGRHIGQFMLMWFIVPFGTIAVAAHTLCQRLDMILMTIGIGMGHGAAVLVGQNLGARQPQRAERSGWLAVGMAEIFSVFCSVAMLLWAENVIRIFSTEPGLVELGGVFLRIAAAGYLVMGFPAVLQHSIAGAGDTLPPMLITLLMVWLVQIPLAALLPNVAGLGVYGVRWAMIIGSIVGATCYTLYFRLGRWKRKKILTY